MASTLLIAEDDPFQRRIMTALLEKQLGFATVGVTNGKEAVEAVRAAALDAFGAVLLDISMPEMDGFEALRRIRELQPDLPILMLTAQDDTSTAVRAIKEGANDFISKPADPAHLEVALRNAMRLHDMAREISRLKRARGDTLSFHDIIGHNAGLAESVALARKAAAAEVPTLITGETGVGKELFARAIHGEGRRAGAPFIAINCGAIPVNLVESVLFGHEKGAFTGAIRDSLGKFREAEGGTIFLDEVGELPLETQVKLLRVLQQKEVEPVGTGKAVKVDVRIISATNRDLKAEVRAGTFRDDLYFRLNVLPVHVPPLRERPEDVLTLARYFLQHFAASDGLAQKQLLPDATTYLARSRWPGNVRELENLIRRAMVLGDGETIDQALLAQLHDVSPTAPASPPSPPVATTVLPSLGSLKIALQHGDGMFKEMAEIEREAMRAVLEHFGHNVTQAAKALGIAKSTFYRKMKE